MGAATQPIPALDPGRAPTADCTIQLINRAVNTFYKDGTTWAHRGEVADALGLEREGEELVDLQQIFREKNVTVRQRSSGIIDAVAPQASARSGAQLEEAIRDQPRGYSGGYYPSTNLKRKSAQGGHTKNYTPFKNQTEEYFGTHKAGRVFNLQSGKYVTGQENRVFVDGYTNKNGTTVNPVTRSYPNRGRAYP